MEGKKLSRIGEKTKDVGPESFWGPDVPLYKLAEGTPYLMQFGFVCTEFASITGANGRYVHMRGYMASEKGDDIQRIPGPEGETGDIAVSTGAKTILARLDALVQDDGFPTYGRFETGGKVGAKWYDYK